MVRCIVVAAFKVTESRSVAYRKYYTLKGFSEGIAEIITKYEPDYISVRVVEMDDAE